MTVVGADSQEVTVSDTSRIVSLNGGITEILFALGKGDDVVGRDVSSDFPGTQDIATVTDGHDVSAEGVLALNPTLVVVDARTGPPEALSAIRKAGVPVLEVPEVWALDEMAPRVELLAQAVGEPEAAGPLLDRMGTTPTRVAGRPSVAFLYLRGNAAVYLLGGDGSGADSLLEAVGAVDAGSAAGLGPFTALTPEGLAAAQPDALLVMQKGLESVGGTEGLLALPGVAQTPAGANRAVIVVPDGELLNFGPRTPQTLRTIAVQLRSFRNAGQS
ncbi:MAG: ABC transporter substrate-binding protein [Candidatus Nanopelagicales bacterium]